MFGITVKRHRRGQPITAKNLNSGRAVLEQVARLRGARGTIWSPGGVFIDQPGVIFRLGQTYSDGIPAQANGLLGTSNNPFDVTISVSAPDTANLTLRTTQFRAFNMSSQSVQPLTYIICALMWNLWIVIWEDCPAPSS